MPRLTRVDGSGAGDLEACLSCKRDKRPVEDCGMCPRFQEAIEKLCCLENIIQRGREIKEEEYE